MKRIFTIIITLLLMAVLVVPAYAAQEEADLEYINTQKDVVFWVSWDQEQPLIIFIAPDGTEYDPNVTSDTTTTIVGEKDLYYVVLDAQAGQWRVRYDKGNNTEIKISVHDYQAGIRIESFTIGEVEGNYLPVHFLAEGAEGTYFQYRISAMVDHTGMEKELRTGSAMVGNDITDSVYLGDLSTYDGYMLKLYIWYDQNGTDIFDFAFSEPFAYINNDLDNRAEDFALTVLPEEQLLYIFWPDLSWSVEKVMVAVFEDGASEPSVFDEYDPNETDSVQLAYDPSAKQVDVEFIVTINGVNAAPKRKTLHLDSLHLTLPKGDAFNSLSLPMTYTGFVKQPVTVTVNGYASELILDGDGSVNITLGDDWNTLSVSYLDAENITWQIQRQIFVDRIPPILTMNQPYDGMRVTGKSITITGIANDCAALTVNGTTVNVNEDGMFTYELKLQDGGNALTVIASDKMGNEAQYSAMIYCGDHVEEWIENEENKSAPGGLLETLTGPGSYWGLAICSVVCLLVIVYALIFWRKEGKK